MYKLISKILPNNYFLTVCFFAFMSIPLLIINYLLNLISSAVYALKTHTEMNYNVFFKFSQERMNIYIIILLVSLIFFLIFFFQIKMAFKKLHNNEKGCQKFEDIKNIKAQYKQVHEKDKQFSGYGGIIISRYKDKLYIDDSTVNSFIVGMTRSGKGETSVIPTLDVISRGTQQASVIVNDAKLELASACYEPFTKRGYECYILNLVRPEQGMGFNPFSIITKAYKAKEYGEAQLLARAFSFTLFNEPSAKDKVWQQWAISLSNALILAHIIDCVKNGEEEKINPASVVRFLIRLGLDKTEDGKEGEKLHKFFHSRPENDIARLQYAAIEFAPASKTRPTIFSQFLSKFEIFTYEPIAYMTSHNSLDLENIGFGNKPIAVFLCTPEYDPSNHFLASLFVQQTNYVLSKRATLSKQHKCTRRVIFHLDEAGNMPAIPNLANAITMNNGRNIIYNIYAQSYEQIVSLYGKEAATTIFENMGNTIYIKTSSDATAEKISKEIGYETIVIYSRSGSALGLKKSISESIDRKPLLSENELLNLMEGECVVLRHMKRKNNKGKRIIAYPIYNHGETALKLRYEYLPEFNPIAPLPTLVPQEMYDIESRIYHSEFEDMFDSVSEESEDNTADEKVLGDLLSPQQIINLQNGIIGVEADYENLTFTEFKSFLQDLIDIDQIEIKNVKSALSFVREKSLEKGVRI